MKPNLSRFVPLIFGLGLLMLSFGCSFQKDKVEEKPELPGLTKEEEMYELLNLGMQQLSPWVNHWKSSAASFNPSKFKLEKSEVFEDLEWPEENYITQGNLFYPYLIAHPEGGGTVDIYSYKVDVPAEGKPGFNPDAEVIYFKSNGMRKRLLFMGPSGGFEDAVWLNSDYLLVVGFFETEDGVTPKAWMISPETNSYLIFNYPGNFPSYEKESYLYKKLKNISF